MKLPKLPKQNTATDKARESVLKLQVRLIGLTILFITVSLQEKKPILGITILESRYVFDLGAFDF